MVELRRCYEVSTKKSEHGEQVELFRWCNEVAYAGFDLVLSNAPKPYDKTKLSPCPALSLMHAIPNGGARGNDQQTNMIRGAMLKAEGVKRGVPDVFLPVPMGGYHGLYIEMKIADKKKARPSPEQIKFLSDVGKLGYATSICYGAKEAKKAICEYCGYTYETKI